MKALKYLLVAIAAIVVAGFGVTWALTVSPAPGSGSGATVSVGTGLTGNGSAASPVALATPVAAANGGTGTSSPPGVTFNSCVTESSHAVSSANEILITGVVINTPFTLNSGASFKVGAADASHASDYGLYLCATPGSGNCSLVEDIGGQDISSTTAQTLAWMTNASCTTNGEGLCTGSGTGTYPTLPVIEPPGYYVVAGTSAATTITFPYCSGANDTKGWFAISTSLSGGVSGWLPPTISSPTVAFSGTSSNTTWGTMY